MGLRRTSEFTLSDHGLGMLSIDLKDWSIEDCILNGLSENVADAMNDGVLDGR